jgi:hypothetical protein
MNNDLFYISAGVTKEQQGTQEDSSDETFWHSGPLESNQLGEWKNTVTEGRADEIFGIANSSVDKNDYILQDGSLTDPNQKLDENELNSKSRLSVRNYPYI